MVYRETYIYIYREKKTVHRCEFVLTNYLRFLQNTLIGAKQKESAIKSKLNLFFGYKTFFYFSTKSV